MRQIILDTETTGLSPEAGDRIVEIAGVELIDRQLTGKFYHQYIQPERLIDPEAIAVHGITDAFLEDKPLFQEIAEALLAFLAGAELVIHNAPFDVGFLNSEFRRLNSFSPITAHCQILDTLAFARKKHPGQQNSLDALCRRYKIDNSAREVHGALLDAHLLAQVYLAMTGGQTSLFDAEVQVFAAENTAAEKALSQQEVATLSVSPAAQMPRIVMRADAEALAAHAAQLECIRKASGGVCVWEE
jgi:DNA polymerase-3 subunit epsilon